MHQQKLILKHFMCNTRYNRVLSWLGCGRGELFYEFVLAVESQASYFTHLCLSFLNCKMGVIIVQILKGCVRLKFLKLCLI